MSQLMKRGPMISRGGRAIGLNSRRTVLISVGCDGVWPSQLILRARASTSTAAPASCSSAADSSPLLEPEPIANEILDRHRLGVGEVMEGSIPIEPEATVGIAETRRAWARAQEHAPRHVLRPKLHRLAQDPCFHIAGAEVGGRGQSVRTCADDRYLTG